MEKLGQIPMQGLTDREILLLTYQQLQSVSQQFDTYKEQNDLQLHDVDKRLDAIEKRMQEKDVIQAQAESRQQRLIKWVALGFTAVQIIVSIIIYFISKK